MSSKMIRKIFKQLNSGLKIMNKEKKSHRDLKPSNILYSYTNDDYYQNEQRKHLLHARPYAHMVQPDTRMDIP